MDQSSFVSLEIYNIAGEKIKTVENNFKPAGNYKVKFDSGSLSSGIYFYRLTAGSKSIIKKMLLLR